MARRAPRTSTSYSEDKEALLKRLRRMEGQVRGLQQMVEDNRYCLGIVQQVNAPNAAAREVSLLVLQVHEGTVTADELAELVAGCCGDRNPVPLPKPEVSADLSNKRPPIPRPSAH